MPAIFGFYDPEFRLPPDAFLRMDSISRQPGENTSLLRFASGVFQLGKIPYPGEPDCSPGAYVHGIGALMNDAETWSEAFLEFKKGTGGALTLRGSFCAVLWSEHGRFQLVSDRFGTQPLYVYQQGALCVFASQVKIISAALDGKLKINQRAVNALLSFGEVIGDDTLLEGVTTLPAGSVFEISQSGSRLKRYWQYCYSENHALNWDESIQTAGELFQAALQPCADLFDYPAVPLSGGLDSRFALDVLAQKRRRVQTYTWGIAGCRDLEYGAGIARQVGVPHEGYIFDPSYLMTQAERGVWLTEGHTPATNFHVLPYLEPLFRRQHGVIVDGFAGDGVLGGNFIKEPWQSERDSSHAGAALWSWRSHGFDGGWSAVQARNAHDEVRTRFLDQYQKAPGASAMDKAMAFLLDNRVRRITTCGTEIFRARIPVYQPFMDAKFMDLISTLPHAWRKRHRFYLELLRSFAPVSASAPYQRSMLPASAPYWQYWLSLAFQSLLEKTGFAAVMKGKSPSDFSTWFKTDLAVYVRDLLGSDQTLDRGVMPPDMVRSTLAEHLQGKRNLAGTLGAMISIELFCRLFLDDLVGASNRVSQTPVLPLVPTKV